MERKKKEPIQLNHEEQEKKTNGTYFYFHMGQQQQQEGHEQGREQKGSDGFITIERKKGKKGHWHNNNKNTYSPTLLSSLSHEAPIEITSTTKTNTQLSPLTDSTFKYKNTQHHISGKIKRNLHNKTNNIFAYNVDQATHISKTVESRK